jgi:CRP-like cAMP-binding protein
MISLLQDVPIFAGLETGALELLLSHSAQQEYERDAVVVREGEPGHVMFIIAEGAARICKHFGQPDEVELIVLGPADFFGEMCILEPMPRSATVRAIEPLKLCALPARAFHQLYKAMPAQHSILLLNIARDLSRRLRRMDEVFAARH